MKYTLLILLLCGCLHLQAQQITRFTVKTGNYTCTNLPVSCAYDKFVTERMDLEEIKGNERIKTLFQFEPGRITWILDGTTQPGATRVFELVKSTRTPKIVFESMMVIDTNGVLSISELDKLRFQYHSGTMKAPTGVDSVYQRSGFIHPLIAPNGQVLTNIQPKDHYHHYGIWNPWTHTSFKDQEVDFWNLQKKEGRVVFAGYLSRTMGHAWGGFKALQQHLAGAQQAINEVWDVRVYNSGLDTSRYSWDFTSTLSCADAHGITLLQYRYGGGFGLRATAAWKGDNTTLITDAGTTRNDTDSTRARWVKITGKTDKGIAGMLILCAPDNFDAPQPLRVWADNAEHGELMLNYSPTKMKEWKLEYGKEYRQRYRVIVFNNELSVTEAENAWQAYAHPPVVSVEGL